MSRPIQPIDPRLQISSLWVATLLIFAYVDIFGLFRADMLESIAQYRVSGLTINQVFLTATTLYIILPSLMVALTLLLPPRLSKWTNLTLAPLYALSIAASCIGESWIYYLLGSAVEVVLLLILTRLALKL